MTRARGAARVRLTHLGAAGWEITDGQRVILMDPYLSRLRYRARFGLLDTPELPGDTRRVFGPDDDLVSDTAAVDAFYSELTVEQKRRFEALAEVLREDPRKRLKG